LSSNSPEPFAGSTLKLTISYDGTNFSGSQRQGRRRTVQADLESALGQLFGEETSAIFAGRTDSGVHAAAQVVSAPDRKPNLAATRIGLALNDVLADDLSVIRVERVRAGFHARYDAIWREYRYRIWCGPREPLAARVVARVANRLDHEAMSAAASDLLGTHDFAAFAGGGEGVPWSDRRSAPRGSERTILCSEVRHARPWWRQCDGTGELLEVRIVADGFLPRMVRNIAGALIEIGRAKRDPNWVRELLEQRDRRLAGMTAPAHGLTLWRVGYAGDVVLASDTRHNDDA